MVTERTKRNNRGKEKLHSLKGDENTYSTWQWRCHKPQNKLVQEGIAYSKDVWEDCKSFFKSSATRSYFKELLLPLHSLPLFPKHGKQMKEPSEGRCRLGSPLSFYLPSPTPPFFALPRLLDSSLPLNPSLHCANLLVDIVPLFKFQ